MYCSYMDFFFIINPISIYSWLLLWRVRNPLRLNLLGYLPQTKSTQSLQLHHRQALQVHIRQPLQVHLPEGPPSSPCSQPTPQLSSPSPAWQPTPQQLASSAWLSSPLQASPPVSLLYPLVRWREFLLPPMVI